MATEVFMPKLGLTMTDGTIIEWKKKEGEQVKKGEVLVVIDAEKVTVEIEAPVSGILDRIVVREGDVAPIGDIIAYITDIGEKLEDAPESKAEVANTVSEVKEKVFRGKIKISPLARRIAKENNIDITTIKGTGPDGRLVKEDVLSAIEERNKTAIQPGTQEINGDKEVVAEEELVPLSSMRKIIAHRMSDSFQIPHFYLTREVDTTESMRIRAQLRPFVEEKTGIKLTYTDLLIKMVARSLEEIPEINSAYADNFIKHFRSIDIGLVTAVEGGLLVPVIRQANKRSIAEISSMRADMVQKARERKISRAEMTGSTFTISNMGMFGIDQFSALLQPPEAAILAVGCIKDKATVIEKQIFIRPMMNLTLSIDHRVLDAVIGAQFLENLKRCIENPVILQL